ncbi:MAG TPA: hypothetical protein VHY37_07305 [Tepidisphaeraceae bacterium]|jgi:hypothetical protein|nr:hypothetical protein [Tepidisphaeraceae bacterium]
MTDPKPFNMDAIKPLAGFAAIDESKLANVSLRLDEGRRHVARPVARSFAVLDRSYRTVQQLRRLPAEGESIHCVLTGAYAMFDFIPAILELSDRQPIDAMTIATLSFSRKNVDAMMALADDGLLGSCDVLCSHYFSAADASIYSQMVEAFRRPGFRVVAMRTHAKVLLARQEHRYIVIETSANLRSSHNVEQATVINDRGLYHFHRQWIGELMEKGTE